MLLAQSDKQSQSGTYSMKTGENKVQKAVKSGVYSAESKRLKTKYLKVAPLPWHQSSDERTGCFAPPIYVERRVEGGCIHGTKYFDRCQTVGGHSSYNGSAYGSTAICSQALICICMLQIECARLHLHANPSTYYCHSSKYYKTSLVFGNCKTSICTSYRGLMPHHGFTVTRC